MSRAEVWATDGLPSVFAERVEDPDLPTVLIYAHHDVQPPEPLEEWDGDPFVVREDDGWLFGRGVSDPDIARSHQRAVVLRDTVIEDGGDSRWSPGRGKWSGVTEVRGRQEEVGAPGTARFGGV